VVKKTPYTIIRGLKKIRGLKNFRICVDRASKASIFRVSERFSYDLENWFQKVFVICFISQKIKACTLRFPAEKKLNVEKALFDWPIVLQYDVTAKCRLISRKFSGMKFFSPERSLNQPKATSVCIRSINQSNRSISVRSLFLFCSRVFISRLYESRSIR